MKTYRSPAWLRRHLQSKRAVKLRILTVDSQQRNIAVVVAVPVVDPRKGKAKARPARIRLSWTGEHWKIVGRGP